MLSTRWLARMVALVVARPHLWWSSAKLVFRHVPRQWWRRGLFPSADYLSYRVNGVYGSPPANLPAEDVLRYLEWCRAFPGPIL